MAETKSVGDSDISAGAYAQSFGNLPHKTCYQKLDLKSYGKLEYEVDLRPSIQEAAVIGMKALTTESGGAGTAGFAMVPIFVDPRVIDTTRKYTPIVEVMPRVTNQGMFADYNQITAKGGGITLGEDAAVTETNTTYVRQSTAIKFFYAVGRVTGPSIAAMPSWVLAGLQPTGGATGTFTDQTAVNAKQMEVLVKTREIRELEEDTIINGNITTSNGPGVNGTEYDGIIQLQSTTNKVDKNTSALSLDDINTSIRYAFDDGGRPNLAICSSAVYEDMLGLLTAKIGYLQPQQQVFWGFSTIVLHTMVGDVPVIPSMYMSNTSGSKAIYFLDMSIWEMRVLQDLTYEELAKTNDSEKFMLKMYEALICKNTAFNAWIGEIS